jgi:amidohydrolase
MRRLSWIVLTTCLFVSGRARAQTTQTERMAAAEVTRQIDSLEARLQPQRTAARMASRKDAVRDRVIQRTAELWDGSMQALSDYIGHHPEVGWQEKQSVDTLTKVLRSLGFTLETGVAGLETAFVASWDSPAGTDGPTIGFIGEYDALRGTDGAFHGDQHNAQSPVAISAAKSLAETMAARRIPGRIRLYGTPAEEVGPPAKTIMWKAGVFEDADILLRSHSTTGTGRGRAGFGVCCLNINEVKYVFKGQPAHQLSSWNGRNALEAAVMFYTAVDRLRSTFRPEASIQGVIPEGGVAPNVVPDRTVVDYYIRYPDEVYLEHMTKMMADAARGAAMATGTTVEIQPYGEYRDGISLGSLEELYFAYAGKLGAPGLEAEPGRPSGYEETGWVTRDIPGLGVTVKSSNSPNHTYGMVEDAFTDVGHSGFRLDAQLMAAVAYDFLTSPELRAAVKEEHTTLAGLLEEYHRKLRETYAKELATTSSNRDH